MNALLTRRRTLAGAAPFDPLSIDWHTAFYADDITGLSDGDPVAQWDDSTGNGRHATQATAAARPVYRSAHATYNGQAVVVFDGVDDELATASFSALSQPTSLVFVGRVPGGTSGSNRAVIKGGGQLVGRRRNESVWYIFAGTVVLGSALATSLPSLAVAHFNGASSYIDTDGTRTTGDAGAGGVDSITLGDPLTAGEIAFAGVLNRALTTQESSDLLGWAQAKYGTPS